MNERQKQIIMHALGIRQAGDKPYRNHFVTGTGSTDFADCEALVGFGFMVRSEPTELSGGDYVYVVTPDGYDLFVAGKGDAAWGTFVPDEYEADGYISEDRDSVLRTLTPAPCRECNHLSVHASIVSVIDVAACSCASAQLSREAREDHRRMAAHLDALAQEVAVMRGSCSFFESMRRAKP